MLVTFKSKSDGNTEKSGNVEKAEITFMKDHVVVENHSPCMDKPLLRLL